MKEMRRRLLSYMRLTGGSEAHEATPKGYVPVIVGRGPATERFLLQVKLFQDPCIVVLLAMATDELGHPQQGTLRIPCDVDHFRHVVGVISKSNRKLVTCKPSRRRIFHGDC
ncbi:unnamed protein product [Musa textilis]